MNQKYADNAVCESKFSPGSDAVNDLRISNDRLSSLIDRAEVLLEPVLSMPMPVGTLGDGSTPCPPQRTLPPLFNDLRERSNDMRSIANRLERLLDRVQL